MKWVCTSISPGTPIRSRKAAARLTSAWPTPVTGTSVPRISRAVMSLLTRISGGQPILAVIFQEELGAEGAARRGLRQGFRIGRVTASGVLGHRRVRLGDDRDPVDDRGLIVGKAQQVAAAVGRLLANPRADGEPHPEFDSSGPDGRRPLVLAVEQGDRRQPPNPG